MNRVIDAATGLIVQWDTDVIQDEEGLPETFSATIQDDFKVVMQYVSGDLDSVTITGDIDVSRVNLAVWDARVRSLVTHERDDSGEWQLAPPKLDAPARKPDRSQYKPDFLQEVADAFAHNGYQGVQDKFEVGRRQASRYISRARDAGMIER